MRHNACLAAPRAAVAQQQQEDRPRQAVTTKLAKEKQVIINNKEFKFTV